LYITGIVWLHSSFTIKDVKDGLSHTCMLGEKYVDRDLATTGESWGDDASPFVSGDRGAVRWAAYPQNATTSVYLAPMRDARGNPSNSNDTAFGLTGMGTYNFGSAHPSGFNMAMCDGSVHNISYDVSERVHRCLCNRADGTPFEMP
jgi:prepilin-type processing-associated H-X9-DG protein